MLNNGLHSIDYGGFRGSGGRYWNSSALLKLNLLSPPFWTAFFLAVLALKEGAYFLSLWNVLSTPIFIKTTFVRNPLHTIREVGSKVSGEAVDTQTQGSGIWPLATDGYNAFLSKSLSMRVFTTSQFHSFYRVCLFPFNSDKLGKLGARHTFCRCFLKKIPAPFIQKQSRRLLFFWCNSCCFFVFFSFTSQLVLLMISAYLGNPNRSPDPAYARVPNKSPMLTTRAAKYKPSPFY